MLHAGPDASSNPELMMPRPSQLEELRLSGIPFFTEAALIPHIQSLRTLRLHGKELLDVPRLATMTALQSLSAGTSDDFAAVGQAVPALMGLTELNCSRSFSGVNSTASSASGSGTQSAHLSLALQQLSALASLQCLVLSGAGSWQAQVLDSGAAFPLLEELHLQNCIIEANDEFLAPQRTAQPRFCVRLSLACQWEQFSIVVVQGTDGTGHLSICARTGASVGLQSARSVSRAEYRKPAGPPRAASHKHRLTVGCVLRRTGLLAARPTTRVFSISLISRSPASFEQCKAVPCRETNQRRSFNEAGAVQTSFANCKLHAASVAVMGRRTMAHFGGNANVVPPLPLACQPAAAYELTMMAD